MVWRNKFLKKFFVVAYIGGLVLTLGQPLTAMAVPVGGGGENGPDLFDSLPTDADRAIVWSELQLLVKGKCISRSHATFGSNISKQDLLDGKWFTGDQKVGYYIPGHTSDGDIDCNNGGNWFTELVKTAGYTMQQIIDISGTVACQSDGTHCVTDPKKVGQILSLSLFGANDPGAIPDYLAYDIAMFTFTSMDTCQAVVETASGTANPPGTGAKEAEIDVFDSTTLNFTPAKYFFSYADNHRQGDRYGVGYGTGLPNSDDGKTGCAQLAQYLSASYPAQAKAAHVLAVGLTTDINSGAPTSSGSTTYCTVSGGLTWIVCGIINAVTPAIDFLQQQIINQLVFRPIGTDTSSATYQIWAQLRNVADVVLILIFFIIIFGTSLGIDQYTVKRALPRVVAAAILIQFSYLLFGILNDAINVFSDGLGQIVANVVSSTGASTSQSIWQNTMASTIGGIALIGTATVVVEQVLWLPLLAAVISAAIGLFTTYVTLQVRQMLILGLIVISPIAIVLWILPNTSRFFDLWRKQLVGMMLMYPLMVLIFIAAKLFSLVVTSDQATSPVQKILAALAPIAALFLVPYTYKIGGQLFNAGQKFFGGLGGKAAAKAYGGIWGKEQQEMHKAAGARRFSEIEQRRAAGEDIGLRGRLQSRLARRSAGFTTGVITSLPGVKQLGGSSLEKSRIQQLKARANKAMAEHAELIMADIPQDIRFEEEDDDKNGLVAQLRDAIETGNQAKFVAYVRRMSTWEGGRKAISGLRAEYNEKARSAALEAGASEEEAAKAQHTMFHYDSPVWSAATSPNSAIWAAAAPDMTSPSGLDNVTAAKLEKFDAPTTARWIRSMNANNKELEKLKTEIKSGNFTGDKLLAKQNNANVLQGKLDAARKTIRDSAEAGFENKRLQQVKLGVGEALFNEHRVDAKGNPLTDAQGNLLSAEFLTGEERTAISAHYDEQGHIKS